jgi:hypothetical protein
MLACPDGKCPVPGPTIGAVLYAGPFSTSTSAPEQTVNVTVPGDFAVGRAMLLATHFCLQYPSHSGVRTPVSAKWHRTDDAR